jgi:hypothetical protein
MLSHLVRPYTKRSEALKLEELHAHVEASLQLSYPIETVLEAIYSFGGHSSNIEFQRQMTLSEKKYFLRSVQQCCFFSFSGCPLVFLFSERSNRLSMLILVNPLNILNSLIKSDRFRRSSSVHR